MKFYNHFFCVCRSFFQRYFSCLGKPLQLVYLWLSKPYSSLKTTVKEENRLTKVFLRQNEEKLNRWNFLNVRQLFSLRTMQTEYQHVNCKFSSFKKKWHHRTILLLDTTSDDWKLFQCTFELRRNSFSAQNDTK